MALHKKFPGLRCACEPVAADRMERSFWMRLLPGIRAYRCRTCGTDFLASKRSMDALVIAQRQQAFESRRETR